MNKIQFRAWYPEKQKKCIKCGSTVKPETQLDYPYYCPNCEENLYNFEVKKGG